MTAWTKTPNAILETANQMTDTELRLTMALVRQTYGYHRTEVKLTYDAMQELTGLSRGGLSSAIDAVSARGFFTRGRRSMWYANSPPDRLKSTEQTEKTVYPVDQNSPPGRLNPIDYSLPDRPLQLNKEIDPKEKLESADAADPDWQALMDLLDVFTAVTGIKPPPNKGKKNLERLREKWLEPLQEIKLMANSHSPDIIRQAAVYMRDEGLTIASPASIANVARTIFYKRSRASPADTGIPDDVATWTN